MEKLIQETLIEHMEFGTIVFDVVYIEGERNMHTFEDVENSREQLLASFILILFDWSWAWELTVGDSLPMFIASLNSCT